MPVHATLRIDGKVPADQLPAVAPGSGDVVGPAGVTGGNVVLFDGATGKLIKDGGTLGTSAFTASTSYDATGAAASAQAAAIAASLPLHGKADTAGAADTAVALTTGADRTKLDGIAAGAEVNVNADWNSVAGDSQILNKPTITGSNTGDQTSIVGISGTIAQFNTACTDADFATGGGTATNSNTGDQTNVSGSSGSCTGNAATATKLAATKTINGTAFDGSANIDAVPTWKCGQTTRDISTASGAQNIAHGLGRVPKFVHIRGYLIFSATVSAECNGYYDGASQSGMNITWTEGSTVGVIDNMWKSTAAALGFNNAGTVDPFAGATKASGVITVDGTNIIITWTKTGSPTGTVNLAWECT